jgi:hypothetical protein
MTKKDIERIFGEACRILYHDNQKYIDEEANEESIVPFMTPYLKSQFKGYDVVNGYNREGPIKNDGSKRDPKRDIEGNCIYPDIIVHQYGPEGENLVAIEVKGYWNTEPRSHDEKKLRGLHSKQGYKFIYRIELGKDMAELIEVEP